MHGILLHKEEEMVRRQYEQKDLHPACTADGNDDTAHAHTRHIHFLLLEFFCPTTLATIVYMELLCTARDNKVVLKCSTSSTVLFLPTYSMFSRFPTM